jgi:hypothetical protein
MERVGVIRTLALSAALIVSASSFAQFSDEERSKVLGFWASDGRYDVVTPNQFKDSPWQVRLTPQGSLWLWAYNNKLGYGKIFDNPVPKNAEQRSWENWIQTKVAYDRWAAQVAANASNKALGLPEVKVKAEPAPGPIPEGLRYLVGDAPLFASAVQPRAHVIAFPTGIKLSLVDNPDMRVRYPYYRFADGVMSGGTQVKKMSQTELDDLFGSASIAGSVQRVMKAVSLLEGGFDSINTYDTGYVSVGFIQFACLSKGSGSLGAVLLRQKSSNPASFETDFRQYGLDVSSDGCLIAMNPSTGEIHTGYDAALTIIRDKRLIAVFQHAGQSSKAFRVAQLQVAKEQYYPGDDAVTLNLGGNKTTVKIGDFIRSEAGMATLMDRKVNTGNVGNLSAVASSVANSYGVRSVEGLAEFEAEIIRQMKYRKDYTADGFLTQPAARASRNSRAKAPVNSRKTTRSTKRGG